MNTGTEVMKEENTDTGAGTEATDGAAATVIGTEADGVIVGETGTTTTAGAIITVHPMATMGHRTTGRHTITTDINHMDMPIRIVTDTREETAFSVFSIFGKLTDRELRKPELPAVHLLWFSNFHQIPFFIPEIQLYHRCVIS